MFVLTAFIPGITGRFYQQFALTIAIPVIVGPQCADAQPGASAPCCGSDRAADGCIGSDAFNRLFVRAKTVTSAGRLCSSERRGQKRHSAVCGARLFFGNRLPSSFLPEDQGYLYVNT